MRIVSKFKVAILAGLTSLLLLLNSGNVKGQMVRPMDMGLPDTALATCTDSAGNYYVLYNLHKPGTPYVGSCRVAVWNGTFWSTYPPINYYHINNNSIVHKGMAIYQNELYVSVADSGKNRLIRWHNDGWDSIPDALNKSFSDMFVANNHLIVVGGFDSLYHKHPSHNIAAWNGSYWDTTIAGVKISGKLADLDFNPGNPYCVYKNKLYVAANIAPKKGEYQNVLASWTGTSWTTITNPSGMDSFPSTHFIYDLAATSNRLYAFSYNYTGSITGPDSFFNEWNDSSAKPFWTKIQSHQNGFYVSYCTSYKNRLVVYGNSTSWFSILNGTTLKSIIKPGDGYYLLSSPAREYHGKLWFLELCSDGSKIKFITWNGSTWQALGGFFPRPNSGFDVLPILDTTTNHLFVSGTIIYYANVKLNFVGEIAPYSYVKGNAYIDMNGNCKFDSGDVADKYAIIESTTNSLYTITDSNGDYTLFTNPGFNNIVIHARKYLTQSCPLIGTDTFTLSADSGVSNVNFASVFTSKVPDLKVSISCNTGYRFHPSIDQTFYITYENVGSVNLSGRIYFQKPKRLINFSSSPVADSFNDPIASWSFSSLAPGDKKIITVKLHADKALNSGDSLVFYVRSDYGILAIDSDKTDNFDTLIMISGDSHDPNGKQSCPPADITQSTKEIKYHIDFQNTGTTSAYQVVVIDTIDVNLPLTKVVMNSASHKYRLDINNNVFRWTFENINLADAKDDSVNSRGYISYTTQIKPGLAVGTEIKNKAYIYFDYNPPMPTNQTMNKIGIKTSEINPIKISESINVYPNPANEELMIDNRSPETKKFIIYNSVGQAMTQLQIGKDQREILNTTAFPADIYFIRGEKGESTKFVIQH